MQKRSFHPRPTVRPLASLGWMAGLVLSACSQNSPIPDYPDSANPSDEISKLESELSSSCDQHAKLLAPSSYQKASKFLDDAKDKRDSGKSSQSIFKVLGQSRSYLAKIEATCQVGNPILADVIQARNAAMAAEAPTYFKDEFESIDKDLLKVGEDLESQNAREAEKKRSMLQTRYLDVELRSIKEKELRPARQLVHRAEEEGAKEFAPKTLKLTKQKIEQADAFITINRRNNDEIRARSEEVTREADHLLQVTRKARSTDKANPEDLVLGMEAQDSKINHFASQANELEGKGLVLERAAKRDRERNAQFERIRKQFTSSEAEVYRQGSKILVRLKGLFFPFGKHVVVEENYPLLTKVQDVIKDMGEGTKVVVEGHSDSKGGKDANQKVSAARANAVRGYLVANRSIAEEDVTAIGYGEDRPLRSNKTDEGRSINRRVDIIITPPGGEESTERNSESSGESDMDHDRGTRQPHGRQSSGRQSYRSGQNSSDSEANE